MIAPEYKNMSDLSLLELCVWREARGEPVDGQRGVAHVVRNRVYSGTRWWGDDWRSVILHPWQFSSFNPSDPNSKRWPSNDDYAALSGIVEPVFSGTDADLTNGATFYYDTSIKWPVAWGPERNYDNTLNIGRLKFFKLKQAAELNLQGDA